MTEPAVATHLVLRASGIHKTYHMPGQDLHILRGVDLELRSGEILAIVGASGVGKTTLMHILGLLEAADSGRIWIAGEEVAGLSPNRQAELRNRTLGFVFQFYHLLPDLNALENVVLPSMMAHTTWGWWRNRRALRERGRELLAAVGLSARARHRAAQLSGGERQRVAIARALMNEPRLLLCDEPTGNLDVGTGREVMDLLWELREKLGQTYLLVTHDEGIADRADRKLRMIEGTLREE